MARDPVFSGLPVFGPIQEKMSKRLFIQRRVKPYQANGRTTFGIRGKPGVYLIYKAGEVVYVGYSGTNLYKAMYRHFQRWNDPNQNRVTYSDLSNITVRVVYTNNSYRAERLEKALINRYQPPDNTVTYQGAQPSPVVITEYINEPVNPIVSDVGDLPF